MQQEICTGNGVRQDETQMESGCRYMAGRSSDHRGCRICKNRYAGLKDHG